MTSLLDIGPVTKKVELRPGFELEVRGVTAKAVLLMLNDFPELRKLMAASGPPITPDMLIAQAPGVIATFIAAGCGYLGNKEALAKVDELTIGEQGDLVLEIWQLTFPRGVSSFTEALRALSKYAGFGWDQATPSPELSSNASKTDTTAKESGTTPQ